MAASAFKSKRSSFIAPILPPISNAFYYHCQRVGRQTQIWFQVYLSDMIIPPMEQCKGYEIQCNDIQLKWLSNNHIPSDQRLSVCGKCTGNCNRCSCGKNKLVCTLLCKCLTSKCQNRNNILVSSCKRKSY